MVELTAINAYKQVIQAKARNHELFWQIKASSNHPEYTLLNQNPILVFPTDEINLTSKIYSWPTGLPKTIEYADICKRHLSVTADPNCQGPCAKMEFILSSCEDDYDFNNNLLYPDLICQSVCSSACMFIVGLFETNGQLIDASQYQIKWSTGSTGSYVMMMGAYYNTLTVEVRKGDCIWRGRYWKSCSQYHKNSASNPDQFESKNNQSFNNLPRYDQIASWDSSVKIYNLQGQLVAESLIDFENLTAGIYFIKTKHLNQNHCYKILKN